MLNFYRGLEKNYDPSIHGNGIYFTTDTHRIFHGGESYSGSNEKELDSRLEDLKTLIYAAL